MVPAPCNDNQKVIKPHAHAPVHKVLLPGTYMVTAATLYKEKLFNDTNKLQLLHDNLLALAKEFGWALQAWAVFANHYHFVGVSPETVGTLPLFMQVLHGRTAKYLNDLDGIQGRSVWYQYRDTNITFKNSYYTRLNYVIQNPVKHGLVNEAIKYPRCSARWFYDHADTPFRKTVESFKIDRVKVPDDF